MLRNIEEEMEKAVVEMKRAGESHCVEDVPIAPANLCTRFSRTCDWKYVTGFDLSTVEKIIAKGVEHYKSGMGSKIPQTVLYF